LRSDGVRFVTLRVRLGGFFVKTPWVFDTLVQRRFRGDASLAGLRIRR
jgi:hypothetical protein